MPSPIVHITSGYIVYRVLHRKLEGKKTESHRINISHLLIIVGFAILPDLDAILGIILGDFGKYHNNGTHSLITGALVALGCYAILSVKRHLAKNFWFWAILFSYESHVILDMLTFGRGVMLFWPIMQERFLSPYLLFVGLHWSEGLFSTLHLWTILTEGLVVIGVLLLYHLVIMKKQINQKSHQL
jgi:membrane-bound metal-dependent hydrolase YbcI (DUF457 family)